MKLVRKCAGCAYGTDKRGPILMAHSFDDDCKVNMGGGGDVSVLGCTTCAQRPWDAPCDECCRAHNHPGDYAPECHDCHTLPMTDVMARVIREVADAMNGADGSYHAAKDCPERIEVRSWEAGHGLGQSYLYVHGDCGES